MDSIYLYNKYGRPVTWEQWVSVYEILGMAAVSDIWHAITNYQIQITFSQSRKV
jgi:hypothetical protein